MKKKITDIIAVVCLLIAIVSGFMLHADVHHHHIYDRLFLWRLHEIAGLLMGAAVAFHCAQHKYWFKNYSKIKVGKKRITTLLLIFLAAVIVSGLVLMSGSQSKGVSLFHYVTAIAATLIAIGHVAKRWKILRSLK